MATAVSTSLVLALVAAALLKGRDRAAAASGLATFGLHGRCAQRGALHALIAVELGLACALAAGSRLSPDSQRAPAAPERLSDSVLRRSSRRGFLERAGTALIALAGGRTVTRMVLPDDADAYTNFCGHTYTTGNCPHPTGLPRVDHHGYPLRAADGHPVDDLGRPIDADGRPVDEAGEPLREPDGEPLAPAPRSKVCHATGLRHGLRLKIDGSWYRCCGGQVRRLMDCCGHIGTRINGDAALRGYCYRGHRVFCVQYYDTRIPC